MIQTNGAVFQTDPHQPLLPSAKRRPQVLAYEATFCLDLLTQHHYVRSRQVIIFSIYMIPLLDQAFLRGWRRSLQHES